MKEIFKKIVVAILTLEAKLVLAKYKPHVVGITGTVGKTSTKDAIYTALSSSLYVRKSEKSYNSEIGIPLTILGCENAWSNPLLWIKNILKGLAVVLLPNHYPKWLVLEIGLDKPLDIERIVSWVKLDVAVYTRLATVPVHVEFFESPKALIDEKKKMAEALKPGGVLVYNSDDEMLREFSTEAGKKHISFGLDEGADVRASNREFTYKESGEFKFPSGIHFKVEYDGNVVPITTPGVLGKQHAYPVLAGIAVAATQDINLVKAGGVFMNHKVAPGRMRVIEGDRDTLIIDDTYNSSPTATKAAIETIGGLSIPNRKVCVLGDMMELGKFSVDSHKEVGEYLANKCGCALLVTVGPRAHYFAEGAVGAGMAKSKIVELEKSVQASEKLKHLVRPGDVILIKGSQSTRMEKVVYALMADQSRSKELLVRQEEEWLKR